MKTLKDFLECNFATPMNTFSIGDIIILEGNMVCSEDILQCIKEF